MPGSVLDSGIFPNLTAELDGVFFAVNRKIIRLGRLVRY